MPTHDPTIRNRVAPLVPYEQPEPLEPFPTTPADTFSRLCDQLGVQEATTKAMVLGGGGTLQPLAALNVAGLSAFTKGVTASVQLRDSIQHPDVRAAVEGYLSQMVPQLSNQLRAQVDAVADVVREYTVRYLNEYSTLPPKRVAWWKRLLGME